jgi:hypothetical protein
VRFTRPLVGGLGDDVPALVNDYGTDARIRVRLLSLRKREGTPHELRGSGILDGSARGHRPGIGSA